MHYRCSFVLTLLQSAALLFLLAISVFTTQDQLLWLFLLISYDPKMLCLCSDAKIKFFFFFVPTLKVDLKASCEVKAKLKKAKVTGKRRVLLILFALKTNNILKKQAEKIICKLNRSRWDRIQKLSETTN